MPVQTSKYIISKEKIFRSLAHGFIWRLNAALDGLILMLEKVIIMLY